MCGDREDARLKQVLTGVLEQTRIALAANDFVVDPPRLFASSDLTNQPPVAVPNGELGNRRSFRNRKEVSAFEHEIRVVAKDLLDVRRSHLRSDTRVDLDRLDWERARERIRWYLAYRRRGASAAGAGNDHALGVGNGRTGRTNQKKQQNPGQARSQWHKESPNKSPSVDGRTPCFEVLARFAQKVQIPPTTVGGYLSSYLPNAHP